MLLIGCGEAADRRYALAAGCRCSDPRLPPTERMVHRADSCPALYDPAWQRRLRQPSCRRMAGALHQGRRRRIRQKRREGKFEGGAPRSCRCDTSFASRILWPELVWAAGPAPRVATFYILLYADKFHATPRGLWQIVLHSLEDRPIVTTAGQAAEAQVRSCLTHGLCSLCVAA